MVERKRKRNAEVENENASKKASNPGNRAAQRVILGENEQWKPVFVSSPGLKLSSGLSFKAYAASSSSPRIMLRSEDHPAIDYTAQVETRTESEGCMRHYVAVYDPQAKDLKLVPSQRMVVRSTLKSARPNPRERRAVEELAPLNYLQSRQALALEFGSKKAQKLVKSSTANAISTSGDQSTLTPVAKAVLNDMPASVALSDTSAALDDSRACPQPNLAATTPTEVYSVPQLVGSEEVLTKLRILDWTEAVRDGCDIPGLKSRYVANRIGRVCIRDDGDNTSDTIDNTVRIRVLKYLYMLLSWHSLWTSGGKTSKRSPALQKPEMVDLSSQFGREVVHRHAYERFTESHGSYGTLTRWHVDYFLTHVCALTLIVDDFATDVYDVAQDLGKDVSEMAKYYRQLGCVTRAAKWTGQQSASKIAELRIPLEFPKARRVVRKQGA